MNEELLPVTMVLDLLQIDTDRLLGKLNEGKVRGEGPVTQFKYKICVKTTKEAFPLAYDKACAILAQDARDAYIDRIKVKHLVDANENFWGDFAEIMVEGVPAKMVPIESFNLYQEKVWDLALPQCRNAEYMALGLGEAGEVQGKVKKVLRGDYTADNPDFKAAVKKELGDTLYYLAGLAKILGFSLQEIAESNIAKLHDRRDRGVLQGNGDNR